MDKGYLELDAMDVAKEALELWNSDEKRIMEYDATLPTDHREFLLWRPLTFEDVVQRILCRHDSSLQHPSSRRSPYCQRQDAVRLLQSLVFVSPSELAASEAEAKRRNEPRQELMDQLRNDWARHSTGADIHAGRR